MHAVRSKSREKYVEISPQRDELYGFRSILKINVESILDKTIPIYRT